MYLQSAEIKNIRSLKHFKLEFDPKEYAGWHVLIGDNGSGKTTLVRSIALGLIGPDEAKALRQNWADWLHYGKSLHEISLEVVRDQDVDSVDLKNASELDVVPLRICFVSDEPKSGATVARSVRLTMDQSGVALCSIWGKNSGWFSASYGPFRRFSGGNKDYDRLYSSNPVLARHLSAFGEDVALTECLDWLQTLHVKGLEGKPEGQLLNCLKEFINEGGLLPHATRLEHVSSDAVAFRDGNGCRVGVDQLSDGYRSILSMTFELIRQMTLTYGTDLVFQDIRTGRMQIPVPGVVIIDEIDAHLHPTWQRRIGRWFRRYFPKVQFIVTTHSPLVCQAAEEGSVWRLPTPGDETTAGRVKGIELQRLIYGSVLEAFDTELFGPDITRSESSKEKLARLARLNQKSLRSELTAQEQQELDELRATLPTAAGVMDDSNGG